MATEHKYGFEVPSIPGDETIMLFRAKDAAFPALLECYAALCEGLGSPQHHVDHIRAIRTNALIWQSRNRDKVRPPD